MRPRAIQSVPGLDPNGSPFERFRQFAGMIAAVPREEASSQIEEVERKQNRNVPLKQKDGKGPSKNGFSGR
jgi:hypothetical protein